MSHARQQIRDAVALLLTGLTTTGANVFANRVYKLEDAELPALLITTPSESSEPYTIGASPTMRRQVQFEVEARAIGNVGTADVLDTIAAEVEAALGADHTLGGKVKNHFLTATEISHSGEGDQVSGALRMTFDAVYVTAFNDPETLL